jgi:hypothetical protein
MHRCLALSFNTGEIEGNIRVHVFNLWIDLRYILYQNTDEQKKNVCA